MLELEQILDLFHFRNEESKAKRNKIRGKWSLISQYQSETQNPGLLPPNPVFFEVHLTIVSLTPVNSDSETLRNCLCQGC